MVTKIICFASVWLLHLQQYESRENVRINDVHDDNDYYYDDVLGNDVKLF